MERDKIEKKCIFTKMRNDATERIMDRDRKLKY